MKEQDKEDGGVGEDGIRRRRKTEDKQEQEKEE